MRKVGIREFKDHATTLLAGRETLVIERHGRPVGFFIPIEAKDRKAGRDALDRLGAAISEVLDRSGVSEETLVDEIAGKPRRRN